MKNAQARTGIAKRICLVSIAIAALAGFCFSQAPSDWPEFHNTNMQRWNPDENVLNVNNVGSIQLKWSYALGAYPFGVWSSAVVVNGVVYIGSQDFGTAVYALDAATGGKLWSYGGTYVLSSLAVANGMVYAGSYGGDVYALDASTGSLVWSYATNGSVYSSPAVANGVVYIASSDNNVYALNASTGALLWKYATNYEVYSSPAVADGVVYIGSLDHNVYALNASTGALLWSYLTGDDVFSSPAVAKGVVYIASTDTIVYALNASTGALVWQYRTGAPVYNSSPAIANGVVYVGSRDYNVYALNATTGAVLWSYNTGGGVDSSPAVANGVVYIGSLGYGLRAVNAATGAPLWSYATGNMVLASPVVVNGAVYIGSDDGNLYVFSLPGAELNLSAIPYPTPPVTGGSLTYAFKIWNDSPDPAEHEVLTTQVPSGTTFSSIELSGTAGLASCTTPAVGASGAVVCKENSVMRPGSTWTIRLTVKIVASAGTVLTQTATASADDEETSTATLHNTVR